MAWSRLRGASSLLCIFFTWQCAAYTAFFGDQPRSAGTCFGSGVTASSVETSGASSRPTIRSWLRSKVASLSYAWAYE